MRILILGAGGMLGHKLLQRLAARDFDVLGTVRGHTSDPLVSKAVRNVSLVGDVVAQDIASVARAIHTSQPDAVLNCIGIIKQLDAAKSAIPSITVNALFPHQLAGLCADRSIRLIHFSTDCVFSGDQGPYREDSSPDARDLYGRTKLLGEVAGPGALTIRSSIIGHELRGHLSLVDWFLSQRGGRIRGFANALYSGLTTPVMADLVADLLLDRPHLSGVWQVASEPISKYDLLMLVQQAYGLDIVIDRDEAFHCDRRLDGSRFRAETGWVAPSWPEMIAGMHADRQQSDANRPWEPEDQPNRQGQHLEA